MGLYAVVQNGAVTGFSSWSDPSEIPAGYPTLVLIDDLDPQPQVGWTYDGTPFTDPVEPPKQGLAELATNKATLLSDLSTDTALWQGTQPGDPLTQNHIDSVGRTLSALGMSLQAQQAHLLMLLEVLKNVAHHHQVEADGLLEHVENVGLDDLVVHPSVQW